MEYDEILDSWDAHNKQATRVYVEAACDALRRKHTLYTNKDIQKHVMKDVLRRELCAKTTLYSSWPDWVRREYKKTGEFSRQLNSQAIANQAIIEEYKAVDERAAEPEYQEEAEPSHVTVTGIGTNEKYVPTPMEMYEDALHAFDRAWQALTNKNHIMAAGGAIDVQNAHIKSSRKLRLRLFKGLDTQRAIYFHNMLVSMEMLIKDSLDMWDELKKEGVVKEIKE